jgi:hypothetical protein
MAARSLDRRPVVPVLLACTHLTLACAFLWGGLGVEGTSTDSSVLRLYRAVSGLFRDYSFFAPTVSSGVRLGFLVDAPEGPIFEPLSHPNAEVMLRVQCIAGNAINDLPGRELLGRSLAATALGRHPDVETVTVVGQRQDLPSAEDYRAGARPRWETLFLADYSRKATP